MRTTITIDDDLWEKAKDYTGLEGNAELIRRALRELVQREAGKQLAAMGGSDPDFKPAPRRRPPDFRNLG